MLLRKLPFSLSKDFFTLSANSVCQAGAFSVTNLTLDNEEIKMKVKKVIVRGCTVNLVTASFLHLKALLQKGWTWQCQVDGWT